MKKFVIVVLVLIGSVSRGQVYLETTRLPISGPTDGRLDGCNPLTVPRSLTFDIEPINGGDLDIAVGKTIYPAPTPPNNQIESYLYQVYNNGSGEFPLNNYFPVAVDQYFCTSPSYVNKVVFGLLRPSIVRRDLAVLTSATSPYTYIYHNSGNGISGSFSQALPGAAIDGVWGAFDFRDNAEDLIVTDGSQLSVYVSNTDGTVVSEPILLSSIVSNQILVTQINAKITDPLTTNKLDIVGYNGNNIKIWRNNNFDGLEAPQTVTVGGAISSIVVADINNDDYNDIVVGYANGIKLFLNALNGGISTTPAWTFALAGANTPLVAVADLGSFGDPNRNDGWNDVVIVNGTAVNIKVFINLKVGNYFSSVPQQDFDGGSAQPPALPQVSRIMLSDVQTTGGPSLVYALDPGIYVHKHVNNPAPAPPRGISWSGTSGQHPTIRWRATPERDIDGYNLYKFVPDDNGWYWKN